MTSPDSRVLRALRFNPEALSAIPDLPRQIASLRSAGYEIDEPSTGRYRIVNSPTALIADDVAASIPENTLIGREIIVLAETGSTNDVVGQAGRDGAAEGMVIFAESQRAGRGRLNRKWNSPPGLGLLFSVLLRPTLSQAEWPQLTFCAALAVARTAEAFTRSTVTIKWPNDVLANGRKIAGILLETHAHPTPFVVLGIGLNVLHTPKDFPDEIKDASTSITIESASIERRIIAGALLGELNSVYAQWRTNFAPVRDECEARGCAIGD